MRRPLDGSNAAQAIAVAEELAQILAKGRWHEFDELFDFVAKGCWRGDNSEPCREVFRLHVYGRLQNWLLHGWAERDGTRYRALGDALLDVNNHAAADHCRNLVETVRATGHGYTEEAPGCL